MAQYTPLNLSEIKEARIIDVVDSTVLKAGVEFMEGFITQDAKKAKFNNLYVKEGVMYAANGSSRVGLFKAEDLGKIYSLSLRRPMLAALMTFLDSASAETVSIRETERMIIFTSPEGKAGFGFRKPAVEMPQMPITVNKPTSSGIVVDRTALMKKLKRLSVSLKKEAGWMDAEVSGDVLTLKTVAERPSVEHMACKSLGDVAPFMLDYATMQAVLPLFQTTTIEMFVENNRATIYNSAELIIEEKVRKSFLAVALMILPRRTT